MPTLNRDASDEAPRYELALEQIPVDFFADPDGEWTFDDLARRAGFDPDSDPVAIGALKQSFCGHPAGSAVVTLNSKNRPYVAIVDLSVLLTAREPVQCYFSFAG